MDRLVIVVLVAISAVALTILAVGDASRIGVAGTLLGGVLGFATAYIVDRARRSHEDRHRFDSDRRDLYARFVNEADRYDRAVSANLSKVELALAAREELPGGLLPTDTLDGRWSEVEMIASAPVAEAGEMLRHATHALGHPLFNLVYLHDDDQPPDVVRWGSRSAAHRSSSQGFVKARRAFLDAARFELGVQTHAGSSSSRLLARVRRAKPVPPDAGRLPIPPGRQRSGDNRAEPGAGVE